MKVLHIGKFYPFIGGIEKVIYDIMTGVSEKGIDCDLLCSSKTHKGCIVQLNQHSKIICASSIGEVANTMISFDIIFKIRKLAKNYNIIHIHHPDPMACLALFFSGYKGKVILHWHSDILKQKKLLKLYYPFQKWLLRRSDLILGTSPIYINCSKYLKPYILKTKCIPIGIDPVTYSQSAVQHIKEKYAYKKIVFSVGRFVEYKGFNYLIEAAKYLSKEYVILIAGDGVQKNKLEADINRLKLNAKVQLLGRLSDQNLANFYGACDVFCLPSVMKTEAFGIVQLEAMSCMKPIIATKISGSGVSWVNEDKVSGLNVTPRSPEEIASAIQKICIDIDAYQCYAQNAYNRYMNNFTKSKMIDNMITIYSSVLN